MTSHWLLDRMAGFNESSAMIWENQQIRYCDLLDQVKKWQELLYEYNILSGMTVAFVGDYSLSTTALLLALIVNKNIVVPLTPMSAQKLENYLKIAQADVVIEFHNGDEKNIHIRQSGSHHELVAQLISQQEPGLLLFSSGSTGDPKASLHNFNKLIANFQKMKKAYRSLTFLLLDHIGGINTLFYLLSCGGTAVSPSERTPSAICSAIESYKVQLLPTSPTFLNMLLISESYRHYDLSSLEVITYGTESMPEKTLDSLHEALPWVKLKQTYGLSELGIPRTQSRESNSLWMKIEGEGFETKVVDGILWIRSQSVMLGYLNAPNPFAEDGWFNTGDAVEVDGEYIRILGRTSEIINVGGEKVYPAEVENVLLQVRNIKDAAVRSQPNPVTGHVVVALVNIIDPEPQQSLEKRIRDFCTKKLAPYKIPVYVKVSDKNLYGYRFKRMRAES